MTAAYMVKRFTQVNESDVRPLCRFNPQNIENYNLQIAFHVSFSTLAFTGCSRKKETIFWKFLSQKDAFR